MSFVGEIRDDGLVPDGQIPPKAVDFKGWTELLANGLATGDSAARLRSYLKKPAVETWKYVNWLTHAKNAVRMDAEIGIKAVEHLLGTFTVATLRLAHSMKRCDECASYEVVAGVCRHCRWVDPAYEPPPPREWSEEERARLLAGRRLRPRWRRPSGRRDLAAQERDDRPGHPRRRYPGPCRADDRLRELVARARDGRLRSSEMSGATLTVTNLGDRGVETVFGVIYPPQVALVGFGTVVQRPWACQGLLDVRPIVTVILSADHRATDGHIGSRFLTEIDRLRRGHQVGCPIRGRSRAKLRAVLA